MLGIDVPMSIAGPWATSAITLPLCTLARPSTYKPNFESIRGTAISRYEALKLAVTLEAEDLMLWTAESRKGAEEMSMSGRAVTFGLKSEMIVLAVVDIF